MYKHQDEDNDLEPDTMRLKRTVEVFHNIYHGSFGIELELNGRKWVVTKVKHSSLAWSSGVLIGDTLHSINGTTLTRHMELDEIYKMMKTKILRLVVSSISQPEVEGETNSPLRKKSSFSLSPFTKLNIRRTKSDINITDAAAQTAPVGGETGSHKLLSGERRGSERRDSSILAGLLSPLTRRQRSATVAHMSPTPKSSLNPSSANNQTTHFQTHSPSRRDRVGSITPVVTPEFEPLAVPKKGRRSRSASVGQSPKPNADNTGSPLHKVSHTSVHRTGSGGPIPDEPPPVYTPRTSHADTNELKEALPKNAGVEENTRPTIVKPISSSSQ